MLAVQEQPLLGRAPSEELPAIKPLLFHVCVWCYVYLASRNIRSTHLESPWPGINENWKGAPSVCWYSVQAGCVLDRYVAYLHFCMHSVDMRSTQISCTCPRCRIFCLFSETFGPLRSRGWRDDGRTWNLEATILALTYRPMQGGSRFRSKMRLCCCASRATEQ